MESIILLDPGISDMTTVEGQRCDCDWVLVKGLESYICLSSDSQPFTFRGNPRSPRQETELCSKWSSSDSIEIASSHSHGVLSCMHFTQAIHVDSSAVFLAMLATQSRPR